MIGHICRAQIESAIAQWSQEYGFPVFFENVAVSPPDGGRMVFPYVHCIIRSANRLYPNVEGTRTRTDGIILMNIFAERGSGMHDTTRVLEALEALFHFNARLGRNTRITNPIEARATYFEDAGMAITPTVTKFRFE